MNEDSLYQTQLTGGRIEKATVKKSKQRGDTMPAFNLIQNSPFNKTSAVGFQLDPLSPASLMASSRKKVNFDLPMI